MICTSDAIFPTNLAEFSTYDLCPKNQQNRELNGQMQSQNNQGFTICTLLGGKPNNLDAFSRFLNSTSDMSP